MFFRMNFGTFSLVLYIVHLLNSFKSNPQTRANYWRSGICQTTPVHSVANNIMHIRDFAKSLHTLPCTWTKRRTIEISVNRYLIFPTTAKKCTLFLQIGTEVFTLSHYINSVPLKSELFGSYDPVRLSSYFDNNYTISAMLFSQLTHLIKFGTYKVWECF